MSGDSLLLPMYEVQLLVSDKDSAQKGIQLLAVTRHLLKGNVYSLIKAVPLQYD